MSAYKNNTYKHSQSSQITNKDLLDKIDKLSDLMTAKFDKVNSKFDDVNNKFLDINKRFDSNVHWQVGVLAATIMSAIAIITSVLITSGTI